MGLFKRRDRRSAGDNPLMAFYLAGSGGDLPLGYHSILESPEVGACIDRIAAVISSATIYLMRSGDKGDKRVKNRLSRFVDVTPWPDMGTRQLWMNWIVTQMLGPGDGNAFVLPRTRFGGREYRALEPMPGAFAVRSDRGYEVQWKGMVLQHDDVLHFRLFADPDEPWRGRGYRLRAGRLAASLRQTEDLKDSLSSPEYKPPLIVSVDTDSDLADEEARDRFREKYLESADSGKPWIIPSSLISVSQVKPLTLTDLAVKDTVELDKRAVAAIFGVPPSLVGIGEFSQKEYNNFIRSVVIPICRGIEQELTSKLLDSDDLYFRFNDRRLYAYDMADLVAIDLNMSDRGFMCGDEVREDAGRDPAGLTEYRLLENYIPYDAAGDQKKLIKEDPKDAET